MMWVVQHEWPSGTQLTFNCYYHWATLMIWDMCVGGDSLYIKEGVTQGDPIPMIVYGILFLKLIQELRAAHPKITQPWYAADSRDRGSFSHIQ